MKAITLWQPWASLLACGAKKYETRSWATSYRGPIAIHAAKKSPFKCAQGCGVYGSWGDAVLKALCPGWNPVMYSIEDELEDLPTGAVIATAELVGCHEMRADKNCRPGFWENMDGFWEFCAVRDIEELFGDWSPGRYAWEFKNMQMLPEPIPAKGGQRIWNWNECPSEQEGGYGNGRLDEKSG